MDGRVDTGGIWRYGRWREMILGGRGLSVGRRGDCMTRHCEPQHTMVLVLVKNIIMQYVRCLKTKKKPNIFSYFLNLYLIRQTIKNISYNNSILQSIKKTMYLNRENPVVFFRPQLLPLNVRKNCFRFKFGFDLWSRRAQGRDGGATC